MNKKVKVFTDFGVETNDSEHMIWNYLISGNPGAGVGQATLAGPTISSQRNVLIHRINHVTTRQTAAPVTNTPVAGAFTIIGPTIALNLPIDQIVAPGPNYTQIANGWQMGFDVGEGIKEFKKPLLIPAGQNYVLNSLFYFNPTSVATDLLLAYVLLEYSYQK